MNLVTLSTRLNRGRFWPRAPAWAWGNSIRFGATWIAGMVSLAGMSAEDARPGVAPIDIGSRRELFVDRLLIDRMSEVRQKLHEPQSAGTVLVFDRPWEGVTSCYASVFEDRGVYRMYYRASSDPSYTLRSALKPGETVVPEHPSFTCYAESRDGITWTRPDLGLYEFNGSRHNNIVWAGEGSHNFFAFYDGNPVAEASERYKAVGSRNSDNDKRPPVLLGFVSEDGKHWREAGTQPILTDGAFDSLNVVFWDAERSAYTAIYRDFAYGLRTIKCAHSKDFLHWSAGEWADFGDAPPQQLYTNAAAPYIRAPQIYVAMPRRFFPTKTHFSELARSDPGLSDAVFMSSRDGVHWARFEEAWIRPGRDERNWVHRANTPCAGLLATAPDELSFFVERNYTFPTNRIERMVLRADGFVSINAGASDGELITKPIVFSGHKLVLNYSTSAFGSIRIEIQDAAGHPIPGFYLEDTSPLFGDRIDAEVSLGHPGDESDPDPLGRLAGKAVRLRFVMRDADLYAMQFR